MASSPCIDTRQIIGSHSSPSRN